MEETAWKRRLAGHKGSEAEGAEDYPDRFQCLAEALHHNCL